jgi:tetratricopeptide (TPR) repeat protein
MKSIAFLFLAISLAIILPAVGQEDANYWLSQTQRDYQNGSDSLALQDIEEYLDLQPGDTWAWSFKANILIKMKRYSEAVDSFDELIKLDQENDKAYNDRALILSGGLNQDDDALESVEKALNISPKNANYWFNKGMILESMGSIDDALQAYGQAVALNSALENAWYRQGLLLQMQGSYNESLFSLDQAIGLNDQNADAWNVKGLILMAQGLGEQAKSCFERAAAIVPSNQEFQKNLLEAQESIKQEPERTIEFNSSQ